MGSLNNRQSGFAALGIATLLAVLVIVGVACFGVYKNQHKQDAMTTNTTTTTPAPTPIADTTPPAATLASFDIPELGIKLTVPPAIKDLTYTVKTVTLPNGEQAKNVSFSTASLTKADVNCEASAAPLGVIQVVDGQYPVGDSEAYFNYGKLLKQFPNVFVTYASAQGSCTVSKDATILASIKDSADKFKQATPSVELTK